MARVSTLNTNGAVEIVRADDASLDPLTREILAGLLARPLPWVPSRCLYDERGSALFDEITVQPEYYQTRTERALLAVVADEVVARARPVELCEIGSGTGTKPRFLLDAMAARGQLERCVLLDVCEGALRDSARELADEYPGLAVRAVIGNFLTDLPALGPGGGRLAAFFAGTIGNIPREEVSAFLGALARQLAPGDGFLVGLDLVKDPARLHAAYNDAAGVTAAFNANALRVVNAVLQTDFEPGAFEHVAVYDPREARVEMRLRARQPMRVHVKGRGLTLLYKAGDEIRTEISCKYTRPAFEALLGPTPLILEKWYTDPEELFALALLRREEDGSR